MLMWRTIKMSIGLNLPKYTAQFLVKIQFSRMKMTMKKGLDLPKYTARLRALFNFGTRRNITNSLSPFVHSLLSCLWHTKNIQSMVMKVPVIGWKSKIEKMIQRYHLFMARSLQRPMHHYFCSPHMTCNMFDLISLSLVQIYEMKKPPPRLIDSLQ